MSDGAGEKLVGVTIAGTEYRVPEGWELLRCFQYLDFKISYERFCWNQRCENCAARVADPGGDAGKTRLCCRTPAVEGMTVEKLPEGVVP